MTIEQHDNMSHWRCPMLGGPVPFSHCRRTNDTLPCNRIRECWHGRIDTDAFLKENYPPEQLKKCLAPPPSRVDRIISAVEQFKGESETNS